MRKEVSGLEETYVKRVHALGGEDWRRLHGDHAGLAIMQHMCEKMRLSCTWGEMNQRLKECEV